MSKQNNRIDEREAHSHGDENTMLLLFRLSDEIFGISVICVSEIIDPISRTEVPNSDEFSPAIINVRGAIVPLLDIRKKLKIPESNPVKETRIVVLEMLLEGVQTKIALIADAVTEVIATDINSLETIPELGARWPKKYIKGIARHRNDLVVLIETSSLFLAEAEIKLTA